MNMETMTYLEFKKAKKKAAYSNIILDILDSQNDTLVQMDCLVDITKIKSTKCSFRRLKSDYIPFWGGCFHFRFSWSTKKKN